MACKAVGRSSNSGMLVIMSLCGGIISVYDPVTVKFGVRVQGCENKYDNVPVRTDFLKYAEQLLLCTV